MAWSRNPSRISIDPLLPSATALGLAPGLDGANVVTFPEGVISAITATLHGSVKQESEASEIQRLPDSSAAAPPQVPWLRTGPAGKAMSCRVPSGVTRPTTQAA